MRRKKAVEQTEPIVNVVETKDELKTFNVSVKTVAFPKMSAWAPFTDPTERKVFIPLPIRLIVQIPDNDGAGCIIKSCHGDEIRVRENIVEVLTILNGYPLGEGASSWSIAK